MEGTRDRTQSAFSTGVPAIRPRTSRSTSDRSRSSRLCSRLWKARKTHHLTLTLGESPLRPLRALLQNLPPPFTPSPPTKAKPRQGHRSRTKDGAAQGKPPKFDYDEEDISDALIADPLQELFGIHTYKGENTLQDEQPKPRTPVRYFASAPAELTPPPVRSTSMSSRGTNQSGSSRGCLAPLPQESSEAFRRLRQERQELFLQPRRRLRPGPPQTPA